MKDRILAKKYIKAFCNSVPDPERKEEIESLIEVLVYLQDKTIWDFLKSPIIRKADKKVFVWQILEKLKINGEIKNFLGIVIQKNRVGLLDAFTHLLKEELLLLESFLKVKFFSAVSINEKQQEILVKGFSKLVKKQIKADFIVDPEIIGGIKVQIDHTMYDGTIVNSFQELKKAMYIN